MATSKKEFYKTVEKLGEAVLVEKKSKFIAHTKPVRNEQEALGFLQEMRSQYADATHNVYAYIIGENNISRYSDDGEPNGTSGMPVLDTLRSENVIDVITVVTRYFGGTLLGTGGLVRAYSASASEALKNAGIITRVLCRGFSVTVEYSLSGKVQYLISNGGYFVEKTNYAEEVEFSVFVKISEEDKFIKELAEACAGRARIKETKEKYIDIKE
ncbi:MAG: YigZ family protein [Clostridia bacterium]|nr:YigZ family protein [Clostridia bacterium]